MNWPRFRRNRMSAALFINKFLFTIGKHENDYLPLVPMFYLYCHISIVFTFVCGFREEESYCKNYVSRLELFAALFGQILIIDYFISFDTRVNLD